MARYQVTLAYDGSGFTGSQRQAKSRTVQGDLEKALHKLGWSGRSVLLSGRTDTGVHAIGQVAAFDLGQVAEQRLYQLVREKGTVRERTFAITFEGPGVEAFAFTFG